MQRYLLVEQAVHIRPQGCDSLLQAADRTQIHPLHLDRREAEQDSQHRNDSREREERQHRREEVKEDIQPHLRLIRRQKTMEDMQEVR